ncbi:MAG: MoaD/ThiS family protein [Candidatus Eremiobacteraeota bacterium]|nr:MoaD/ThiS family protein [Candidatus Eremiobacteraeota bacterium]
MNVRVLPFARIREIIGATSLDVTLAHDATAGQLWHDLASRFPALAELTASTRLVCNGAFVADTAALRDGDEVGLLPPFGGG